ncbi:MAG: hypothetical protein OEQ28_11795 [Acidobacteriota bacterium]|nr:hypothetical protein [Acidobacteriota bacterium]
MELATGLVILSLEEPERFFTNGEIDSLLDPEKMVPLKTNDVPHWEIMFFTKKRINKPNR